MAEVKTQHTYQVGDSVIATLDGAEIPGVIEDERDGRFQVRLAQPWSEETGRAADSAWLGPDQLRPTPDETMPESLGS